MTYFHFRLSILLSSLIAMGFCVNAQAVDQETTSVTTTTQSPVDGSVTKVVETTRQVVKTQEPTPKEITPTPEGYVACNVVKAAWFGDTWVPEHKVCTYKDTTKGVVWVEGYWGCNKVNAANDCTNWEWRAGRWESKVVEY